MADTSCAVATQTTEDDREMRRFKEFDVDLDELFVLKNYQNIDNLQGMDIETEKWPELLVQQLAVRDSIISSVHSSLSEAVSVGSTLEGDVDYFKLKILDLEQQIAQLRKQLRRKKRRLKNQMTQTNEGWEEWYRWYSDYYRYHNELTNTVTLDQYKNEVPSKDGSKPSITRIIEEFSNSNSVSQMCDDNQTNFKKQAVDNEKEQSKQSVSSEEKSDLYQSFCDTSEQSSPVDARNDSSEKDDKMLTGVNKDFFSDSSKDADVPVEKDSDKLERLKKELLDDLSKQQSSDERGHVDTGSGIMAVQEGEVTSNLENKSGFVYQEHLGLYYDYSTGYYYNAENGLYYDSSSGTYFYYDHETGSYQFHSRVDPSGDEDGRKRSHDLHRQNEDKEIACLSETISKLSVSDWIACCRDSFRVAPSLRLIVTHCEGNSIPVGTLYIVTVNGGTLGCSSHNFVILRDSSMSKTHAEVKYKSAGEDDHHYFIRDLGSSNGTYVNGVRLSESKTSSEEVELGHGWKLTCGGVSMGVHIHPGHLTCNECEPGIVSAQASNSPAPENQNPKSREQLRRSEMKALRKKYGLTWTEEPLPVNPTYVDRAHNRRLQKGSDNPYEKTEMASEEMAIASTNKGFTMLQKMGWMEGESLGKTHTGITEPVQSKPVIGRTGLGAEPDAEIWLESRRSKEKRKIQAATLQRFQKATN